MEFLLFIIFAFSFNSEPINLEIQEPVNLEIQESIQLEAEEAPLVRKIQEALSYDGGNWQHVDEQHAQFQNREVYEVAESYLTGQVLLLSNSTIPQVDLTHFLNCYRNCIEGVFSEEGKAACAVSCAAEIG